MTTTRTVLPTLDELLDPSTQPAALRARAAASTDPLDPIQLFNMSYRDADGGVEHLVLPEALTGVRAKIVVMSGRKFPTGSLKVGPAYSCLREGILDGSVTRSDCTLVFPSTGNYGIGGAWVGPRLGFRSLVVLPEDMSRERFEKIRAYGAEVRTTPGSESNVKEIYDEVARLRADPNNRILNQFEAFANYRFHHHVTGGSALALAEQLGGQTGGQAGGQISAFVSAMGSAGTLAAADRIRAVHPGCKTVAVEPVQCPTLYDVGYGAHAIEGIGDKHVTWIHNVRATDLLVCVDDQRCLEGLQLLQEGRELLADELGLSPAAVEAFDGVFGISGVCNVLAAIQAARHWQLGPDATVLTVATDGFDRYPSVMRRLDARIGPMTPARARARVDIFRRATPSMVLEGTMAVRRRWHNQKYFTWVEQQGKTVEQLDALWEPEFWAAQAAEIPALDAATLALRSEP